jgi:DNA-binding transcriptional LysR family regulator
MHYKGITLLQIECFLAVAKYLSFTEAAKRLYTSQPSLSRQIAQMEDKLGVVLFNRTKRDVSLTPSGAVLFNELSTVMNQIEVAFKKCMELSLDETSRIAMGFYATMDTDLYLNQLIQKFREIYSQVEITLEKHSFKELRERLDSGKLDMIFTLSFEVEQIEDIVWHTVHKQNACILMSSKNPLANNASLALEDLHNENFVLLNREESPNAYDGILAQCKRSGFTPKKVIGVPNSESLLLSVESGLGVAIIDQNIRMFRRENYKMIHLSNVSADVVMARKKTNLNPALMLMNSFLIEYGD